MTKSSNDWLAIWCPATGESTDISPRLAARITGRPLTMVRKWISGAPIPRPEMHLLRFEILGLLPGFGDGKWRLLGGALSHPDHRQAFEPTHILATHWIWQHNAELRREVSRLREQLTSAQAALARQRHGRTHWPQRRKPMPQPPQQLPLTGFPPPTGPQWWLRRHFAIR